MIVIVVEGVSDEGIIDGICDKLFVKRKILLMRGNNPKKAVRLINSIRMRMDFDKIIMLKDLHNYREEFIRNVFENIKNAIYDIAFYGIIVKKEIEAWLLADENIISKYAKCDVKIKIGNPEVIDYPAKFLDDIFRRCGKRYIKSYELGKKLAQLLDLEKAKRKCRSLNEFLNALRDC